MIRKAHNSDILSTDPTPEEIRQRTEAIRKTWSPRERARRTGFKQASWMPPMVAETDLPGFLANEFER